MDKLINENGRPVFGVYTEPFRTLNVADLRKYGSRSGHGAGHKRWVFMGVLNRQVISGLAIVHLGYLSNMFAYVFDRQQKRIVRQADIIVPFGLGTKFSGSSLDGTASFRSGGASAAVIVKPGMIKLDASFGGFSASLVYARPVQSLNVVTRNGLAGFNYTCKEAGMSVQGSINAGDSEYVMDPSVPSGAYDYTLGVIARNTFWNWASGGGSDSKGRKLGFNFAQGVNETGYTENAFWVDGKMVKVDNVDFMYDDLDMLSGWAIRSSDGRVDMKFKPEGERFKDLNIGVIKSYFHQPFGTFTGTLSDGGERYELGEVYGFTEEHEAVW